MTTFAITAALVVGQELQLNDGTRLHVELSSPAPVHCVLRKDAAAISVIALCGSERDAEERMKAEEEIHQALAERSESGGALQ